jgi:hypothetical protein
MHRFETACVAKRRGEKIPEYFTGDFPQRKTNLNFAAQRRRS